MPKQGCAHDACEDGGDCAAVLLQDGVRVPGGVECRACEATVVEEQYGKQRRWLSTVAKSKPGAAPGQ